ncbi:MAG: hypothetical protein ACRDQF_18810, partial [Thermocrispum sp.]
MKALTPSTCPTRRATRYLPTTLNWEEPVMAHIETDVRLHPLKAACFHVEAPRLTRMAVALDEIKKMVAQLANVRE